MDQSLKFKASRAGLDGVSAKGPVDVEDLDGYRLPVDANIVADAAGLALEATAQEGITLLTAISASNTAIQSAAEDTTTPAVSQDTATIMAGTTALTPKFAAISSTDDGDTVALVASKKIRVLSMFFVVAGATTVKFQSGASTDKTGAMSFAANGGISLPFNPVGWFETASGEKLNHVLGSAVAIAGGLTYVEV